MFLAREQAHLNSSAKDPAKQAQKQLLVEPLKIDYADPKAAANAAADPGEGRLEPTGRAIVALDKIGAGDGQLVLIVQGSSARMTEGCSKIPIDAAVVGLVDEAVVLGKRVHPEPPPKGVGKCTIF